MSELSSQTQNEGANYVVNKKLMVEELLNCKPLQEKLASKINYKIATEHKKYNSSTNESKDSDTHNRSSELVIGNIEKDLLPSDILDEIINSIFDEPELDELIETVIVKDNPEFHETDLSASRTQNDECEVKNLPINLTLLGRKNTVQAIEASHHNQKKEKSINIEELAKTQLRSKSTSRGAHLSNFKFKVLRNKQLQVQQTRNKTSPPDGSSTSHVGEIQLPIKSVQTPTQFVKLLISNPTAISNVINRTTCVQPNHLPSQNKASSNATKAIKPSNKPDLYLNSNLNQKIITSTTISTPIQPAFVSTHVFSGKRKADEVAIKSIKVPAITNLKDNKIKVICNFCLSVYTLTLTILGITQYKLGQIFGESSQIK